MNSQRERERLRMVRAGLLNDQQSHLYRTSAVFHADIDTLIGMLPMWVDGIARHAVEHGERIQRDIEIAKGFA